MIVLECNITDWISASSALMGVPLAFWGIVTLFKRDRNRERSLTALEELARAQNKSLEDQQSQIKELSSQTEQFEAQTILMAHSNKLFEDQLKVREQIMIKSVKPIIHVGQWDYENTLRVTLENVGAGLAIVTKLKVLNEKGEIKNNLYEWLPKVLPNGVNYSEYWTPYTEFVINSNVKLKLIEIPINASQSPQVEVRERLREMLGKLTVHVEYTDIYDNVQSVTNKTLIHFLRADNVNSID